MVTLWFQVQLGVGGGVLRWLVLLLSLGAPQMRNDHLFWHFRLCNKRGVQRPRQARLLDKCYFTKERKIKWQQTVPPCENPESICILVRGEERRSEILWRAWLRLYGP